LGGRECGVAAGPSSQSQEEMEELEGDRGRGPVGAGSAEGEESGRRQAVLVVEGAEEVADPLERLRGRVAFLFF
jgi:hypothetical protein